MDPTALERWRAYRTELNRAEIRPEEMVAAFMRLACLTEDEITVARHHPVWHQLMTVAGTSSSRRRAVSWPRRRTQAATHRSDRLAHGRR